MNTNTSISDPVSKTKRISPLRKMNSPKKLKLKKPLRPIKAFIVLTEENPCIYEITLMFKMINISIPETASLVPVIEEGKFRGEWTLKNVEKAHINVTVKLFKGKTSCVDYMLFRGDVDLTTGNAGDALVVLESTKTSDSSSRNTAVFQRITKFTTYDKLYPNSKAIKVMCWIGKWKDKLSPTAKFGLRLMTTLNIKLFEVVNGIPIDMVERFETVPFLNCNDIIIFKNKIPEKRGNKSIKMRRDSNSIHVSLKLDKGSGVLAGKISHDPNVGFLSAVLNCFEKIEQGLKYIIDDHNIEQVYFDKTPKSKLWYSCKGLDIEFTGCEIKSLPDLPKKYFTIENRMTEKLATILYDQVTTDETIFSNHGACALTSIRGFDEILNVGRKMPRPDIVFRNDERREILIIEGKLEKELGKGIKQLAEEHLKPFISLLTELYPDYIIKKGLCITIDNVENISKYDDIEYPVKFALDAKGFFIRL